MLLQDMREMVFFRSSIAPCSGSEMWKSLRLKSLAFDGKCVPFFRGSSLSEWSGISMHPSVKVQVLCTRLGFGDQVSKLGENTGLLLSVRFLNCTVPISPVTYHGRMDWINHGFTLWW